MLGTNRPMTITMGPNDQLLALDHVKFAADVVRQTPAELSAITRAHRNALASAHGIDRAEQAAGIVARNSELVRQIRARAENAMAVLDDAVDAAVIEPVPGTEGVLGRQTQWRRVQDMLGANMSLSAIIDQATDPEMLNAIMEEYPTWARVTFRNLQPGQDQEILEKFALRIERRSAELAGDTQLGANARFALSVRPDVVTLPALLDAATATVASTDAARGGGLAAALDTRIAKGQAAAALQVVAEGMQRPARRRYEY